MALQMDLKVMSEESQQPEDEISWRARSVLLSPHAVLRSPGSIAGIDLRPRQKDSLDFERAHAGRLRWHSM